MTDKRPPDPLSSRDDRLKAALRDNLRRRKVQARERAEPLRQPAPDESGRSNGAPARSRGAARESGMGESGMGEDGTEEDGMADGGNETALEAKRGEIAALIRA